MNDYHRLVEFLKRYKKENLDPKWGARFIKEMLGHAVDDHIVLLAAKLVCDGSRYIRYENQYYLPNTPKKEVEDKPETRKERFKGKRRMVKNGRKGCRIR